MDIKNIIKVAIFIFSMTANANFFWSRVPNWRELSKQSIIGAAIEVSLGNCLESIKDDENAKVFIRDLALIPSIVWNVAVGEQFAGLNYTYDESHYWAHGSKLLLKIGGGYTLVQLGCEPKQAFRLAAFLGDASGRVFINQGRFYQDNPAQKDESYDWVSGIQNAVYQVVPNMIVVFKINDVLNKKWMLVQKVKMGTLRILGSSLGVFSVIAATATARAMNTLVLSPIGNSVMDTVAEVAKKF